MPVPIEVTTYCNSACVFCFRHLMARGEAPAAAPGPATELNSHMSWELFTHIMWRLHTYSRMHDYRFAIYLHGLGEPLLWPHLRKGFELVRECGFDSLLITNGTLLNEKWCEFILSHVTRQLKVSINGATEQTIQRVTGNPLANRVLENCHRLIHMARQRPQRPREIIFGFVACPENRHEVEDFRQMWAPYKDVVTVSVTEEIDFDLGDRQPSPDQKGICPKGLVPDEIMVLNDGSVQPCCLTRELSLGNFKDAHLERMLAGPRMSYLRALHQANLLGRERICNQTCLAGSHLGRAAAPRAVQSYLPRANSPEMDVISPHIS